MIFVKILGWIISIWVRLVRMIGKKGGQRFWKWGPTIKIKYIITILKMDLGGPGRLGLHQGLFLTLVKKKKKKKNLNSHECFLHQ